MSRLTEGFPQGPQVSETVGEKVVTKEVLLVKWIFALKRVDGASKLLPMADSCRDCPPDIACVKGAVECDEMRHHEVFGG